MKTHGSSWAELKAVIRRIPAPPCEGCDTRKRCAKEQLACLDFASYVNLVSWRGKTDRKPSRGRYIRIFDTRNDE